jgi:hypothetical protein
MHDPMIAQLIAGPSSPALDRLAELARQSGTGE